MLWVCSGLVGLMNKNLVSSLISQYAQVVLWFCRTGLLPEGSGAYNILNSGVSMHDSVAGLVWVTPMVGPQELTPIP